MYTRQTQCLNVGHVKPAHSTRLFQETQDLLKQLQDMLAPKCTAVRVLTPNSQHLVLSADPARILPKWDIFLW